ncbi:hypothetical protein PF007_g29134 [Phytophthora fragariae]|uniref:Uncharacterized protein n=2 Tax=Phytophthora fragariae TaxID=53985 RepID=A0A6A3PXY3_9STRA|nr:hypothetical protein PF003_g24287 [Phytophthora fragariae]KAE9064615.1 hypothetical protein PF007_g29134 [Phytophthora fragariae]
MAAEKPESLPSLDAYRPRSESPFSCDVDQGSGERGESSLQLAQPVGATGCAKEGGGKDSVGGIGNEGDSGDDADEEGRDHLEHWEEISEERLDVDESSEATTNLVSPFVPYDRQPNRLFPSWNDSTFPQQRVLPGDRGFTISLEEVFGVEAPDNSVSFEDIENPPDEEIGGESG